jgi:hypothetical protein
LEFFFFFKILRLRLREEVLFEVTMKKNIEESLVGRERGTKRL